MSNTMEKLAIHQRYFHLLTRIDLGQGSMKRLKKSYERFLYMAAKYQKKFLFPTYAVNIRFFLFMK